MKIQSSCAWTTETEIKYISTIGSSSPHTAKMPRRKLLSGYLAGCSKRKKWDRIDPIEVKYYAEKELAMCV